MSYSSSQLFENTSSSLTATSKEQSIMFYRGVYSTVQFAQS